MHIYFYNTSSWCSCNCWRPIVTPANTNINGAQLLGRWTPIHTHIHMCVHTCALRYVCHFDNYDNYKVIKLTHDKTRRVQWECVARSHGKHCTWTQYAYAHAANTLHAYIHTHIYALVHCVWNKKPKQQQMLHISLVSN